MRRADGARPRTGFGRLAKARDAHVRLDSEIHTRVPSRGKRGARMHATRPQGSRVYAYASPGLGEIASSMHGNHVVVMYDWCGVVQHRHMPRRASFQPPTSASRRNRFAHRRGRGICSLTTRYREGEREREERERGRGENAFPLHFTTGDKPPRCYSRTLRFDRIRAKNNPLRRCSRLRSLSTHTTRAYLLYALSFSSIFSPFTFLFPLFLLSLFLDIYIYIYIFTLDYTTDHRVPNIKVGCFRLCVASRDNGQTNCSL